MICPKTVNRILFMALFISSLLILDSPVVRPEDSPEMRGREIVLVIDISKSLCTEEQKKLVDQVVALVYDASDPSGEDRIHLVTFSNTAKFYENEPVKANAIEHLNDKRKANKSLKTYPESGLIAIFTHLAKHKFLNRIGIAILVTDGEHSSIKKEKDKCYKENEIGKNVEAISKTLMLNGFTIIPVFVRSKDYSNDQCMKDIAEWENNSIPIEVIPCQ